MIQPLIHRFSMKSHASLFLLAALSPSVFAGDPSAKGAIDMPSAKSRWTFGASFSPLLNVESDFSGLGSFNSAFAPQPPGGGRDYEYEDGYVRVDITGNAMGLTGYWGYDNASQYDAGNETLSFNLTSGLANGRAGETEDYSPGFEIFAYYDMGGIADFQGKPVSWGFKGGLHYAKISTGGSRALTTDVLRITDSYDASGFFLFPPPGYRGTIGGNGGLLGDSPTRTQEIIANGGSIATDLDLDVDLITFTVGPYIQIPVAEKFSVSAEAGVSVSIAHGDYEFDTLTSITGLPDQAAAGDETRTVILPGLYAGVSAIWQLTDRFGIHGSARYQYIDQFSIDANGSDASLSFDGAAVVSLGGVWSF
jgi:hypothetical protein